MDPRSERGRIRVNWMDPRSVVVEDQLAGAAYETSGENDTLRNLPFGGSSEVVRGGCTSKLESGVSVMLLVPL